MEETLFSFNRGKISPLALARVDQERVNLSAEVHTNCIPRTLGAMSLRPGWQYLFSTASDNKARTLPFIFANDDQAIVEFTDSVMRVIIDDVVLTRPSVSTSVTNGGFDTDVTGWTDSDQTGATSAWVTGGYLGLTGDGANQARRDQTLTVAGGDQNVEHGLRVVVERGPVGIRVGSSAAGDDDYVGETFLETGTHSLAFTPTGANVYVRLFSSLKRQTLVDSVSIEAGGAVTITSPYAEADLGNVRYRQSGDVIFLACKDNEWKRVERRATRSWSLARYAPENGPFRALNTSTVTLTPSARTGNITLTASQPHFRSTSVGTLYQLTLTGQVRQSALNASDTFTEAIRIVGVGGERQFLFTITGTWTGTITLQRSFTSEDGPWEDVAGGSRTANTNESITDAYDNTTLWFRAGFKSGAHGSGTATVTLNYSNAVTTGVVRVTGYTSETAVSAEVLIDLGYAAATTQWAEGKFSDRRGWPTSVELHEGRLCWAGKDSFVASVSDAFDLFDPDFEGDAGPISSPIGAGPVDTINWMLSLERLVLGGQGDEYTAQTSALNEPLTPTNFGLRSTSSQGSNAVQAVKVDDEGVFVSRAGARVYTLAQTDQGLKYTSNDLTSLYPEAGSPGIVRIAVQRQPDTRIHCVRSDGTVLLGVMDRAENVLAWLDIETDGEVEDVVVLNGTDDEDDVYYAVKRTINGSTVRFIEKWAREDECRGGTLNKQADAFVSYTGASTTTVTAAHLANEEVVIWADGADVGTEDDYTAIYTLDGSGQVTLPAAVTNYVVGLGYTGQWKSTRLPNLPGGGKSIARRRRINDLTVLLQWTHHKGLRYGPSLTNLNDLPQRKEGKKVVVDTVHETWVEDSFIFNGLSRNDVRLCFQMQAPRPCTILAAIPEVDP